MLGPDDGLPAHKPGEEHLFKKTGGATEFPKQDISTLLTFLVSYTGKDKLFPAQVLGMDDSPEMSFRAYFTQVLEDLTRLDRFNPKQAAQFQRGLNHGLLLAALLCRHNEELKVLVESMPDARAVIENEALVSGVISRLRPS